MDHYSEWLTASYTDPLQLNLIAAALQVVGGKGGGVTQLALKCLPRPAQAATGNTNPHPQLRTTNVHITHHLDFELLEKFIQN